MNILFYSPLFHDWIDCIKKIKIPNVQIYITSSTDANELVKLIKEKNISILIPCRYKQMKFIITHYDQIRRRVKKIICPKNYDNVDLFDNKIKFREFMIKNKFQNLIPNTYKINNLETIKNVEPIVYPCIFKLAKTYSGTGSHICLNKQDVLDCEKLHKVRQIFIQEFIYEKNEYAAHMFISSGIIQWGVCYKMIHPSNLFIQKGKMDEYEKINNFDFNIFSEIFKVINYTGFVCIDFKIVNGDVIIFEVNPRLGGTLVNNQDDFTKVIKYVSEYLL